MKKKGRTEGDGGGKEPGHPKLPAGGLETGSVDPGAGAPSGLGGDGGKEI